MKTKQLLTLAMLAVGMAFLPGCQRHSRNEVYYLVANNINLPYWQTAAAGFEKGAAQLKVTAKVVGPGSLDAQAELGELQKAIAAKPAGILVSVADASVLLPGINAAIDAGIPVITMDSDAPGSRRLFFIGTNNLEAGRLGAARLIEKLGGKGNVVFFTLGGQPNTEERLKGFKDVLSTRPDIHIVDVVDIKGDARNAFDKTQAELLLTGPRKVDAFVCLEASAGKVVADAVKRAGGGRLVMAWDVDQDTLNAIKAGAIEATIAQKPFSMGMIGLKALDDLYHMPPKQLNKDYSASSFGPYPAFVDTGTSLVDASNVDFYIAAQNEGASK